MLKLERARAPQAPIVATLNSGNLLEVEQVMFAIGRTPNVEGLGLDRPACRTDRNGAIIVDELSRTSVPSIYAIGDVTDRLNLTPVAIREGHAFADTGLRRQRPGRRTTTTCRRRCSRRRRSARSD